MSGLLNTNLALNMAKSVSFNVHKLESNGGVCVINISASDSEDRVFFPHAETTFFLTEVQLKELSDTITDFRFKQALRVAN